VLNCPERTDVATFPEPGSPLRAIYQGAIGHGRYLDDLLDAAGLMKGVRMTVRVVGVDVSELHREVEHRGLRYCVEVADAVDPGELVQALAGFDVGLMVNRPDSLNDELALPNKVFEYLMAGLAVVAPQLPGVTALVNTEQVGETFTPGSPVALAETLTRLAADPLRVRALKQRARALAVDRYNAEAQRPALAAAWGL
jgi:glycosyltransferase involved in cell wall biosynthesis